MLIDNKVDRYPDDGYNIKTVWDFLKQFSGKESEQTGNLDIVTGYFTIRALSKLYHEIPEEDNFRIVSSEMVKKDEDDVEIIDLLNGDNAIQTSFNIDQCAEDAKAFLQRENVHIKAIVNAFCHAKAYMFKNNNPHGAKYYLTGSSNLTDAGLGLKISSNVELNMANVCQVNDNDYNEVCSWFNDIWEMAADKVPMDPNDPKSEKVSVKEYFIRKIEDYFQAYSPEQIYYKILFELFNSDIELDGSIEHRKDMSLLQTSEIWKVLFNYQQKGVISLIKMLRKYNGAILADAVGLGKTFSALAVIKYFQTQSYVTVLLCPKKLEQNWTQYLKRHGSRFDKDEFDYLVRFHTDLQDDRLEKSYSDAKLSWLRNRKKVLVVIDESHNLRNEKSGRYIELMQSLIQNPKGDEVRDVKVLMLSATPINNGLSDVKGQFNLIGHGKDDAFNNAEFGVESMKYLFTDCQRKYTDWCKDPNRTIASFIAMLPPKFFNLTDKLIVARTRSLIEKKLGENLGFPKKLAPENVYQGVEHFGKFENADAIYAAFDSLSLTAYQPSLFIPESRDKARKGAKADWADDVNRERFLVKMMGILFMKRLESSWFSCKSTVKTVLDVHEKTLQMVIDYKEHKTNGTLPTAEMTEEEDDLMEQFTMHRKRGNICLNEMKNLGGFEAGLRHDINQLKDIYAGLEDFEKKFNLNKEKDLKLDKLEEILKAKQKKANKKVVVFTAYSDTAQFIFDELKKRKFTHMAVVSGLGASDGTQTTKNYNQVLQRFAPYSKLYKELEWSDMYEEAKLDRAKYYDDEKQRWNVDYQTWLTLVAQYRPKTQALLDDSIDILIATDCLSEGQNLQDADLQINYDIHWNPVRLIQRFGRIDRIGSPNKEVGSVNFWPAESFDAYLNLETRVVNRMAVMNVAVADDDNALNDEYKKIVEDNPLQDKNADRLLEELQNNSISDVESPRTLSLKDFSFEVYRQDLIDYFEKNKEIFRKMPNGIFSGFRVEDNLFEQIPESLVAVVGYPHREQGSKKPYTELYLMCQPVDPNLPAGYQELNRAEVLEFLRQNKKKERFVPDWIKVQDESRIAKLSAIIQEWMKLKAPQQAVNNIKERLKSRIISKAPAERNNQLLEEKFQLQNFDLIVWEYVSKN